MPKMSIPVQQPLSVREMKGGGIPEMIVSVGESRIEVEYPSWMDKESVALRLARWAQAELGLGA